MVRGKWACGDPTTWAFLASALMSVCDRHEDIGGTNPYVKVGLMLRLETLEGTSVDATGIVRC